MENDILVIGLKKKKLAFVETCLYPSLRPFDLNVYLEVIVSLEDILLGFLEV